MAYEETSSGSHVMRCDTASCHSEMISPGRDELIEDLNLAGWTKTGEAPGAIPIFTCAHCARGIHPRTAVLKRMFGDVKEITAEAPCPVRKGDSCNDIHGNLIGHYQADAQQGDTVLVKLHFPEPANPPGSIELYDEMLEGTDDDDDLRGRVSAVSGDHHSQSGSTDVAQMDRTSATVGSAASPKTPGSSAEKPTPLQRAPKGAGGVVNTQALIATSKLFDTDWDPDGN